MPPRITRTQFREHFQNKELKLEDAQAQPEISRAMQATIEGADRNGDGKISGRTEVDALFRGLDRFDRDGSYHSMHKSEAVNAVLGAVTDPAPTGHTGNTGSGRPGGDLTSGSISQDQFTGALRGKEVKLSDLRLGREIPDEAFQAIRGADQNGDGSIKGFAEANALFLALDDFDSDGNRSTMRRTTTIDAVLANAVDLPPGEALVDGAVFGDFQLNTNSAALRRAPSTDLGGKLADRVSQYKEVYQNASALTGVPAELIAALHANESGFGDYRPSTFGPESGFGLDDRFVTTSWGNARLAEHGLGRWERGTGSANSILQSAVIAGEHLKRMAGYAGVDIDAQMTQAELAGAATSYTSGQGAGRRAASRGTSWMLNPNDSNPHPLHPGGTSRVRGRTIRVPAARKPGLLRWDVLLPMIQDHIR